LKCPKLGSNAGVLAVAPGFREVVGTQFSSKERIMTKSKLMQFANHISKGENTKPKK